MGLPSKRKVPGSIPKKRIFHFVNLTCLACLTAGQSNANKTNRDIHPANTLFYLGIIDSLEL